MKIRERCIDVAIETENVNFEVSVDMGLIDSLEELEDALVKEYFLGTDEGSSLSEEEAEVVESEIRGFARSKFSKLI